MTGTGQVSIVSNISAIAIASCSFASRVERRCAARIQAMSAPAQNDGPSPARTTAAQRVRRLVATERRERRAELGDERRIERVVALGPVEGDPRDHAVRSGPFDAQRARSPGIVPGRAGPATLPAC